MKISLYPIRSVLQGSAKFISKDSEKLLKDLTDLTGHEFEFVSVEELKNVEHPMILVQSGGSEGFFLKDIFPNFDGPYYLLTYGSSNSLAASLEILTFLKEQNRKGEVLHGDLNYIAERINTIYKPKERKIHRLGIMGVPSDWLISSNVDKKNAYDTLDMELIDISEQEVINTIRKHRELNHELFSSAFNEKEVIKAYQIYLALKELVEKYQLEGFTLRCFDIISEFKMSACLGLALLNRDNIIATCEGDVPAMITAKTILDALNQHAFQANPQWINPKENIISLAHCTYPLDMSENYQFATHFESGIGLAIHGELNTGDCTVIKISADLKEFYCEEGEILNNEYREDRCRTQINIHLNSPVTYFLKSSLGNHHQVIYGHHEKEIKEYLESFGLRQVKA